MNSSSHIDPRCGNRATAVQSGQDSDLGLSSAYHADRSEGFGHETLPTYYHRRKEADAFHIDFAFVPTPLLAGATVAVGTYAAWVTTGLSDHVPLIIDLPAISRLPRSDWPT